MLGPGNMIGQYGHFAINTIPIQFSANLYLALQFKYQLSTTVSQLQSVAMWFPTHTSDAMWSHTHTSVAMWANTHTSVAHSVTDSFLHKLPLVNN